MKITLCGAAGTVTGSGYLVETGDATVLVDFGMFQGHRVTDRQNRDLRPVEPEKLDAVLLTHAHLDHTGRTVGDPTPFSSAPATCVSPRPREPLWGERIRQTPPPGGRRGL